MNIGQKFFFEFYSHAGHGAFASGFGLNSFESCFKQKSTMQQKNNVYLFKKLIFRFFSVPNSQILTQNESKQSMKWATNGVPYENVKRSML